MKRLFMSIMIIVSTFCLQHVDACEKLEEDVRFRKTAYDEAQKVADELYVDFKKKELKFYLGNSKK